jgi:hypothetical protein
MHAGVLLVAAGEAAVLEGGLAETVVLVVVDGAVELEPDVFDGDGCCDPHAATPTQAIAAIVISRNMKVLINDTLRRRCRHCRGPAGGDNPAARDRSARHRHRTLLCSSGSRHSLRSWVRATAWLSTGQHAR